MVRELVGELLHVRVDVSIDWAYLQRLLVDLIWRAQASAVS
jgi:hypothetical protein